MLQTNGGGFKANPKDVAKFANALGAVAGGIGTKHVPMQANGIRVSTDFSPSKVVDSFMTDLLTLRVKPLGTYVQDVNIIITRSTSLLPEDSLLHDRFLSSVKISPFTGVQAAASHTLSFGTDPDAPKIQWNGSYNSKNRSETAFQLSIDALKRPLTFEPWLGYSVGLKAATLSWNASGKAAGHVDFSLDTPYFMGVKGFAGFSNNSYWFGGSKDIKLGQNSSFTTVIGFSSAQGPIIGASLSAQVSKALSIGVGVGFGQTPTGGIGQDVTTFQRGIHLFLKYNR